MASQRQMPALADIRGSQTKQVIRENNPSSSCSQHLIARVQKSSREEFRLTIRAFNRVEKCALRVFKRDDCGAWQPSPRHIVVGNGAIGGIIEALVEAEAQL